MESNVPGGAGWGPPTGQKWSLRPLRRSHSRPSGANDVWRAQSNEAAVIRVSVPFEDIICRLEEPTDEVGGTGRKVHVRFCGSVNTKEI